MGGGCAPHCARGCVRLVSAGGGAPEKSVTSRSAPLAHEGDEPRARRRGRPQRRGAPRRVRQSGGHVKKCREIGLEAWWILERLEGRHWAWHPLEVGEECVRPEELGNAPPPRPERRDQLCGERRILARAIQEVADVEKLEHLRMEGWGS